MADGPEKMMLAELETVLKQDINISKQRDHYREEMNRCSITIKELETKAERLMMAVRALNGQTLHPNAVDSELSRRRAELRDQQ